jgi:hypothetical protein
VSFGLKTLKLGVHDDVITQQWKKSAKTSWDSTELQHVAGTSRNYSVRILKAELAVKLTTGETRQRRRDKLMEKAENIPYDPE